MVCIVSCLVPHLKLTLVLTVILSLCHCKSQKHSKSYYFNALINAATSDNTHMHNFDNFSGDENGMRLELSRRQFLTEHPSLEVTWKKRTTLLNYLEDPQELWSRKTKVKLQHSDIEANVTLSTVLSKLPHFWRSTGFCPPDPHEDTCRWLTSNDMIQNLAYLGAIPHSGIVNVRVHFLLDTVTVQGYSSGEPVYNFSCLDTFIELLHRNGLHPGFEIMGNPSGLFIDFENRTQLYMWRDLVKQLASRYIDIYGLGYLTQWNFESWNEPKLKIFDGLNFTYKGFLNYYDASSEGLRLASKFLRFGGPSGGCKNTYKTSNYCWLLLDHLNNGTNYFTGHNDVRADFISIHEKGEWPYNSEIILNKERQFYGLLEKHQPNLVNLPVFNDEADPLVTWSKPLPWRADATYSSMLSKVVAMHQNAFVANKSSRMHLELLSNDNGFLSYQPWPFHQRTLLARFQVNQTSEPYSLFIRKAVHGVIGLLSLLGDTQVQVTCKHPLFVSGVVNILASTHTPPEHDLQDSWQMSALVYYSTDTQTASMARQAGYPPKLKIKLNINDLPDHTNTYKDLLYVVYALDNVHGNAYSQWKNSGSPATPTIEQFEKMRANQDPVRVEGLAKIPSKQDFSLQYDLPHSGVLLLHACAKSHFGPDQVGELTLYNITFNQVLIVWSDHCVNSRCILRYDVEHSPNQTGTFTKINAVDSIFTIFVHAYSHHDLTSSESVLGYYRVRAVDYWERTGKYSPIVPYKM